MFTKLQLLPLLLGMFLLAPIQQQLRTVQDAVAQTVRTETPKKALTLSWTYQTSTKTDQNGTEVPEVDIAIVVNGATVPIGQFTGYPVPVRNMKKSHMPANAIIAFKTWFSGQGDDFYASRIDDTTVGVFHRHVDEAEDAPSRFNLIKRIIIPATPQITQ